MNPAAEARATLEAYLLACQGDDKQARIDARRAHTLALKRVSKAGHALELMPEREGPSTLHVVGAGETPATETSLGSLDLTRAVVAAITAVSTLEDLPAAAAIVNAELLEHGTAALWVVLAIAGLLVAGSDLPDLALALEAQAARKAGGQ